MYRMQRPCCNTNLVYFMISSLAFILKVPRRHGAYGGWGQWQEPFSCPKNRDTYVIGIQLRIEGKHGGDDTAANDVKLVCSGGNTVSGTGGGPWGEWRDPIVCPPVW
jgi:hypothetical protein